VTATQEEARFVFEEWHRRIKDRDGAALAELYTDDAVLESPLIARVLDVDTGVVAGRADLDHFLSEITRRRPDEDLPSLYRTGKFLFAGETLIWKHPRETPGEDQLDLVEVIELDGARIRAIASTGAGAAPNTSSPTPLPRPPETDTGNPAGRWDQT
jgi:steroid Delta-isomerase